MRFPWPQAPDAILLWSLAALVYVAFVYGFAREPIGSNASSALDDTKRRKLEAQFLLRAGAAFAVMLLVPGASPVWGGRFALAAAVAIWVWWVPWARLRIARSGRLKQWLAEWEMASAAGLVVTTGVCLGTLPDLALVPIVELPIGGQRLAALAIALSTLIYGTRGGTHIVRGVLDKTGALPKLPADGASEARRIDEPEYNRGRMIGNLERLLLIIVVVVGDYEAIGFIVAGKGLIRAKEFEDRNFAEYFIVGNLASVLVAVVLGLFLQRCFALLW